MPVGSLLLCRCLALPATDQNVRFLPPLQFTHTYIKCCSEKHTVKIGRGSEGFPLQQGKQPEGSSRAPSHGKSPGPCPHLVAAFFPVSGSSLSILHSISTPIQQENQYLIQVATPLKSCTCKISKPPEADIKQTRLLNLLNDT